MKNERGSILPLTLVIFAVLMILGLSTLSLATNENKQALYHQHKKQAYYIARSGAVAVEAAILAMNGEEIDELDQKLAEDDELVVNGIDIDGNKVNVVLKKIGNKLFIESTGNVRNVFEKITKVMEAKTVSAYGTVEATMAVFSNNDIIITNGTIDGNIGTNSSILVEGNPSINGDIFLLEGLTITHKDNHEDNPNFWWLRNHNIEKKIRESEREIAYPLPVFPEFPTNLVNKGNIKTTYMNEGLEINMSAYYENLEIVENRSITINTTGGDIVLRIKNFNVQQGSIKVTGSGNVKIFIDNFIRLKGGINKDGDSKNIQIYYNGMPPISIDNETKICGSVYIEQADLVLDNGGSIIGNIVSGGKNISVSGGTYIQEGMIYAPNAYVSIIAGGSIEGAIIANKFFMAGGAGIEFNSEYIDTSLIDTEPVTPTLPLSGNKYKPGYFK